MCCPRDRPPDYMPTLVYLDGPEYGIRDQPPDPSPIWPDTIHYASAMTFRARSGWASCGTAGPGPILAFL
jgi:hypothetical protein